MADRKSVESLDDLSPRALGELKAWFESWYRQQPIDATTNRGVNYGVRSVDLDSGNVVENYVLTATGDGGSRWGPAVNSGGGRTIRTEILNHPCTAFYWPMDDGGPGVTDLISGQVLSENPTGFTSSQPVPDQGSYSFLYEQTGPFTGDTVTTAVHFDGDQAGFSSKGTTLWKDMSTVSGNPTTPTSPVWSILMWVYNDRSYPPNAIQGSVFSMWDGSISGSQTGMNLFTGFYTWGGTSSTGANWGVTSPATYTSPGWHFLVGTVDTGANDHKFYIDGALIGSTSISSGHASGAGFFRLGCTGTGASGPSNFWQGKICQLAIFNCVLTADEVADFFSLGGIGSAAEGTIPVADGDGGITWEAPSVKVDGTNYHEILAGDGLTSTDNSDGTVTLDMELTVYANGA